MVLPQALGKTRYLSSDFFTGSRSSEELGFKQSKCHCGLGFPLINGLEEQPSSEECDGEKEEMIQGKGSGPLALSSVLKILRLLLGVEAGQWFMFGRSFKGKCIMKIEKKCRLTLSYIRPFTFPFFKNLR